VTDHVDRSVLRLRRPSFAGVVSRTLAESGPDSPTRAWLLTGRNHHADRSPYAFCGTIKRVVFDVDPILTEQDREAIHESAQLAAVAHGISA
jgi:hypothetical protein